ncbi:MAG: hypothetical protein OK457_11615 [Thaumarchaeota archaeon]|nr:hypothetical protein [Nitrososphaerota archaeon]
MQPEVLIQGQRKIFRSVHAGLIYDKTDLEKNALQLAERKFGEINVELISSDRLFELRDDFGILGVLGNRGATRASDRLDSLNCLKIGFYSGNGSLDAVRRSLKHLSASIICHRSKSLSEALASTVFHFYASLTLPSLLNIDLADVESIADGIGVSFNESGNSSDEIIEKLPRESYVAKSALMHFSCQKDVTLEEVYKITKTISLRKLADLYQIYAHPGEKKLYKRTKLKMGLRVTDESESSSKKPRISLTAILFGIKN